MEIAELLKLSFSTADAEYPEIHQENGGVILRFIDWQERNIEVLFIDAIAHKWHMIEFFLEGERNDSIYKILDSNWLAEHLNQEVIRSMDKYKHFKFNFNRCGQFEILATEYTVKL